MKDFVFAKAKEMPEGKGAKVKRAFPTNKVSRVNPFLLFDEFFVEQPAGFPMHSHSGFEAVTYMLEGAFEHEDSSGFSGRVDEGEAQRMVTGGGIRHSEMPGTDGMNHGLQLWVDLPEELKSMEPEYGKGDVDSLPVKQDDGVTVKTIVGKGSPLQLKTPVEYFLLEVSDGTSFSKKLHEDYNHFVYVVSGEGKYGEDVELSEGNILVPNKEEIFIEALSDIKFALVSGKPLDRS